MTVQELIADCDLDLRQGRAASVRHKISRLNLNSVSRAETLGLATICRRANLFSLGLRLLTPLLYNERSRWKAEASPFERAEYAALISKNGNNLEALKILSEIRDVPEATLYMAFCHMANWDFEFAVQQLEPYIASGPPLYSRALAQVNLAACLVNLGEWDRSREVLAQTIALARENGFGRLLANCFELSGQMELRQGRWREAETSLNQARGILTSDGTSDELLIGKWQAILQGFRHKSTDPILHFRELAVQKRHWESARDADRFGLMIHFEESRFHYLLFGTPFKSFRERLCQELGRQATITKFKLGSGSSVLDLTTGRLTTAEGKGETVFDGICFRLMTVMFKDFYRPVQLGALFAQLFPGERFNINSSPNRVHQCLWRTRAAMKASGFQIVESHRNYKVVLNQNASVLAPLHQVHKSDLWLDRLREKFGANEFTAVEACQALDLSRSAFLRRCQEGLRQGKLRARFKGANVRYRLGPMSSTT
ncbi:MAG: tetratricopeptide repeat protein [Bdellovibrionales bacterium]